LPALAVSLSPFNRGPLQFTLLTFTSLGFSAVLPIKPFWRWCPGTFLPGGRCHLIDRPCIGFVTSPILFGIDLFLSFIGVDLTAFALLGFSAVLPIKPLCPGTYSG